MSALVVAVVVGRVLEDTAASLLLLPAGARKSIFNNELSLENMVENEEAMLLLLLLGVQQLLLLPRLLLLPLRLLLLLLLLALPLSPPLTTSFISGSMARLMSESSRLSIFRKEDIRRVSVEGAYWILLLDVTVVDEVVVVELLFMADNDR